MRKPVLVVHGVANHDKPDFESRVATLGNAIKADLPNVDLIPVFWGDLGGRSQDISDCLPILQDGHWTTRAEDVFALAPGGEELVRAGAGLTNEERAQLIAGSVGVRGEDAKEAEISSALGSTEYLQLIDDRSTLEAIGTLLETGATEVTTGEFAVRGEETRSWLGDKIQGVIAGIDKVVGKVVQDRLGATNQRLRGSLMNGAAQTLGDIVAYHDKKAAIQGRLWDAIAAHAPGYGVDGNPISVIGHSLGGVVTFDAAVSPASGQPLHIDTFISFGSQPAFFEIMDPRRPGISYAKGKPIALPPTIRNWINMWDVVDLLAFTAGTVFRLSDGRTPEDVVVQDALSAMWDEKLWLHSIYWQTRELTEVLKRALR